MVLFPIEQEANYIVQVEKAIAIAQQMQAPLLLSIHLAQLPDSTNIYELLLKTVGDFRTQNNVWMNENINIQTSLEVGEKVNTLEQLVRKHKPTHLVALEDAQNCFDSFTLERLFPKIHIINLS